MRDRIRKLTRTALYSPARKWIVSAERRVHNHLYNCSTDSDTNGESWLIERFPASGTFLDVGFNEGEWSRAVAAGHLGRSIHAFDPARSVIGHLDESSPIGHDFTFHPIGLSDVPGRATFHEYGDRNGSSSLGDRQAELGDGDQYDVEIDTLDAWAARQEIENITVLKIDAEGFDLNIMEGARNLFDRGAIDFVVFEYASGWFSSGRTLMQAATFVESIGYRMYRLFPDFLAPYSYRVQHEGSAMAGYFVAVRPGSWAESEVPSRAMTL